MEIKVTDINKLPSNDSTGTFIVRYRLASDPDVDGSYTTVTTTRTYGSVVLPYVPVETLSPGVYVIHSYYAPHGPTTGTKVEIEISGTPPPV